MIPIVLESEGEYILFIADLAVADNGQRVLLLDGEVCNTAALSAAGCWHVLYFDLESECHALRVAQYLRGYGCSVKVQYVNW